MTRHILIAEDEASIVLGAQISLEREGFKVSIAQDGHEALSRILEAEGPERFDLLLTDIAMPGLSGLDLAEELRRHGRQIPVVVMTGCHDEDMETRLTQSGISEVLRKPFTFGYLTEVIQEALEPETVSDCRRDTELEADAATV